MVGWRTLDGALAVTEPKWTEHLQQEKGASS